MWHEQESSWMRQPGAPFSRRLGSGPAAALPWWAVGTATVGQKQPFASSAQCSQKRHLA